MNEEERSLKPGELLEGGGQVLLTVRGLTRSFPMGRHRLHVLRGVDMDVERGDFLAIKGASGAGKSTLLHILGLLDRPDGGSLLYQGRELAWAGERARTALRARNFAFVFQFYYLLPEFTALENVVMPALIAGRGGRALLSGGGRPALKKRAAELLEQVGLGQRQRHRPSQLSGGERQRVAIARALMNRPSIVFCDEPTGNLDSKTAASIHTLLVDLNQSLGQTMVIATHDAAMARVARRRLEMLDGIIRDGQLSETSGLSPLPAPEGQG